MALENPYTAQLQGFNAGISNARRGLKDLYKLRRRNIEQHYNQVAKTYGSAVTTADRQYGQSLKAVAGYEQGAQDWTAQVGYQAGAGHADVTKAVRDIIGAGVDPYQAYLGSERKATAAWYRGYKGAEAYEDRTLKTGLAREQPAALSELEQGIVDTQTNLQTNASAFAQQQAYNQSMQGWMNQMLGLQRQMAAGQQGSGGGFQGADKSSPNTAQWGSYAAQRWGISVGGWRAHGSVPGSDHPKGLADDMMVGSNSALGHTIANDFVSNASVRGVKYVIWNHQIWTPDRGWHAYNGPNPHTDHVHVSFLY